MTNLRIIYKKANGEVAITSPTVGINGAPSAFEMLTGSGGWSQQQCENQINHLVSVDGLSENNIRPFYEGLVTGGLSEEEAMDRIAKRSLTNEYISYRITSVENIPEESLRVFRGAWTDDFNTETVDVDINKAKEIKINEFRRLRKPLFEEEDVAMFKAIEALIPQFQALQIDTSQLEAVTNKKIELRDVTEVSLPNDINLLADFIPEVLG